MLAVVSATLPPDPLSIPAARAVVRRVTGTLPRRAREAAELVATELATNCVEHAGTDFEVFAAAVDGEVELVVSDGASWGPARPTPEHRAQAGAGQGLLLVGLLATAWAAEVEGTGKRVWARLCVDDVPTS
jgi:anti-sigma factor RsiW